MGNFDVLIPVTVARFSKEPVIKVMGVLAEGGLKFRFGDLPGQCLVLLKKTFEKQPFFNLAKDTGLEGAFSG